MSPLPNFSAVIFDLDGLVLETESTYFAAWQQTATQMGYNFPLTFCSSLSGLSGDLIGQCLQQTFGAHFNLQLFATLSGQYWREMVAQQGIAVKLGFQTLLTTLKSHQIPFALATNSPLANAIECLTAAGLSGVFTKIVAREQVPEGKPAPDIFLVAAEQLQTPIQTCLVLEDSYSGVLGAYRAGAKIIYIPSNQPDPQAVALSNCQLDDLAQLAKHINEQSI